MPKTGAVRSKKYADDEDLQSILQEAMKLREADRKRAREKPVKEHGKRR